MAPKDSVHEVGGAKASSLGVNMGCESQCNYQTALSIARELVESDGDRLFSEKVRDQKTIELAIAQMIFDKAQVGCSGQSEDGRCGVATIVNDARGFLFGNPSVEISMPKGAEFGFRAEE